MSKDDSSKASFHHETDGSDIGTKAGITDIQAEQAPDGQGHMSVGDILRGTAEHELTPFERKAALVNE